MAALSSFFATALAVIQLAFIVAVPAAMGKEPINYGGSYRYDTAGVTGWLTLAENGVSGYRIVKPAVPSAAEDEAATQLRDYFKEITDIAQLFRLFHSMIK